MNIERSSEIRRTFVTRILALKRNKYRSRALPEESVNVNQSWKRDFYLFLNQLLNKLSILYTDTPTHETLYIKLIIKIKISFCIDKLIKKYDDKLTFGIHKYFFKYFLT